MELISREAALETLAHNQFVYGENFTGDDPIDKHTVAIIANDIECIAKLPTIEERKTGKWVGRGDYKCSICGEMALGYPYWECELKRSRYCPNCGADMRGEKDGGRES